MMEIENEVAELARRLEADREIERTEAALANAARRSSPIGVSRAATALAVGLVAIPTVAMFILDMLASSGIYVEPIRSWWTPELAEAAPRILAFEAVAVMLVFLNLVRRRRRE